MTHEEALRRGVSVILHHKCICAECEDRVATALLKADTDARRECAEIAAGRFEMWRNMPFGDARADECRNIEKAIRATMQVLGADRVPIFGTAGRGLPENATAGRRRS